MASFIKIEGKIIRGIFQGRPNRFLALVSIQNGTLPSFLPNPGRMHELLTPGTEVILREVSRDNRKTAHDLIGVLHNGQMVSVDSHVPNRLVLQALKNRDIEELSVYNTIEPEHPYRQNRFDFLLANKQERCLLEVKSCTLVKDGIAIFPDAKTERGRRHVRDLMEAKKEGYRACVLFVVQRTDAHTFSPNDETDPEFAKVLRDASVEGVEVFAYYSEFAGDKIGLKGKLPVELRAHRDS